MAIGQVHQKCNIACSLLEGTTDVSIPTEVRREHNSYVALTFHTRQAHTTQSCWRGRSCSTMVHISRFGSIEQHFVVNSPLRNLGQVGPNTAAFVRPTAVTPVSMHFPLIRLGRVSVTSKWMGIKRVRVRVATRTRSPETCKRNLNDWAVFKFPAQQTGISLCM